MKARSSTKGDRGTNIELEPFERSDFARLISWGGSTEFLMQWAGSIFSYPLDELQLENYIQTAECEPPARIIFKAADTVTNAVVGHIELDKINLRNKSATVSRVLVEPSLRGKGIGSQMVRKILETGFERLELHRIDLNVFDFNEAAISCYEKIGFVKEGHLRETARVGNDYWSIYTMSILESEWMRSV